LPSEYHRPWQA